MVIKDGYVATKDSNSHGPEIIWCYSAQRDELRSLEYAISSGFVTHVSICIGGRVTENRLHDFKMNLRIRKAIKMGSLQKSVQKT